jgi:hypothetical protein
MATTRVLLIAALVAGFGAVAVAGPYRNCSKLKKWKYDKVYKRGDVVWYPGGMNKGVEYKCDKDTCHKIEPRSGSDKGTWASLGNCENTPDSP